MKKENVKTSYKLWQTAPLTFAAAALLPEYIAPVLMAVCFVLVLKNRIANGIKPHFGAIGTAILAFMGWIAICSVYSSYAVTSLASIGLWVLMFTAFYFTSEVLDTEEKIQKVKTTNTLENLENMVKMLSEKAGTQELAKERFSKFEKLFEDARTRIAKSSVKVFANTNQAELARDLGLDVADTFGPGELTSEQIVLAARNSYALVIDNVHNPVASPIESVSPSSVILQWRNFPEKMEEDALYNVIKADLELLWQTDLF